MADLRQSLHAMVERPPSAPPPVETVATGAARFALRRHMLRGALVLALVVGAAAVGFGVTRQDSEPGISLATEGPAIAGYIAEQPGGYVAAGSWRLTITRGSQVIELNNTSSDDCGPTGVIRPGDEVRGSITGRGSRLLVGKKFACPD
ncbi:MAG: hypothetical protein M3394_00750 [Actinomycetota bacterium]|nr:hypothetical protein [Actinomycetota bacterium]